MACFDHFCDGMRKAGAIGRRWCAETKIERDGKWRERCATTTATTAKNHDDDNGPTTKVPCARAPSTEIRPICEAGPRTICRSASRFLHESRASLVALKLIDLIPSSGDMLPQPNAGASYSRRPALTRPSPPLRAAQKPGGRRKTRQITGRLTSCSEDTEKTIAESDATVPKAATVAAFQPLASTHQPPAGDQTYLG